MSDVLTFPQTQKALKRRRKGMGAAGLLTMMIMERDGEAVPENVARFDQPDGAELPNKSAELLLATLLWSVLTAEQQDQILSSLRMMAYGNPVDRDALQLHNLLTGKR
jgi:hypothetical protein